MAEWVGLPLTALLVAGTVVLLGAAVQGAVGLGLGLLAAPVFALVDPTLVPGTILFTTSVLPVLTTFRELEDVDWRGLGFALLGRLPGTAIGVYIVAAYPPAVTAIVVAVVVLGAVALSVTTWNARPTPKALLTAGVISGVGGTATSVGGPPVALLYQRASGATLRSTMGLYFLVGNIVSLSALALADQVTTRDAGRALVLLPFVVGGFLLSGPLRRHVDRGRLRVAVLTLSAASAALLLARTVFPI
jgi:uncharacterized membrane protein YfcA